MTDEKAKKQAIKQSEKMEKYLAIVQVSKSVLEQIIHILKVESAVSLLYIPVGH